MKFALLLPGYLDSPDYLHFKIFKNGLEDMGYEVYPLDACHLWKENNESTYNITNYISHIGKILDEQENKNYEEIILIGHSLGGAIAIIAGEKYKQVTKIVSLCSPVNFEHHLEKWNGRQKKISLRDLPDNPTKIRKFHIPRNFALDAQQYSVIKKIKSLKKPTMIFIGLQDKVILPEITEQLITYGNNLFIVKEKNIGHNFRNSKKDSMRVMKSIEKFLRQ